MRRSTFALAAASLLAAPLALAQMQMPAQTPGQQMPMQMPGQMQMPMQGQAMRGQGEGEVTRIQKDANRITLRHGPIQALDMAGMNMVFQVKDASVLDKFKVGDKVRFTAVREGGALFAEGIEPATGAGARAVAPEMTAAPPRVLEALPDPHAGH